MSGIYLDFGKAIHRTIELACPNKKKKPITYPARHFTKVFNLFYRQHVSVYKDKDKELSKDDLIASGIKILEDFLNHETLAKSDILSNELEIFETISRTDGIEIRFKGYIDFVILTKDGRGKPVIYICDFKTRSWGMTLEDKTDPELLDQLYLYKYFLCKKFNIDPKTVRCAFIVLKRKPGKKNAVDFIPISAGPVVVQRSIDYFNKEITAIAEKFKSNNFCKNRDSCVDRRYKSKCIFLDTEHCKNDDIVVE